MDNLLLRKDVEVDRVDNGESCNSAGQGDTDPQIIMRPVATHRCTDDGRLASQLVIVRDVVEADRAVLRRDGQLLTIVGVHHACD